MPSVKHFSRIIQSVYLKQRETGGDYLPYWPLRTANIEMETFRWARQGYDPKYKRNSYNVEICKQKNYYI